MTCKQARELLPLFADGELADEEREAVARHLSGCAACRERLALDRRLGSSLSALSGGAAIAHAPASLRARVIDATRGDSRPVLRGALLLSRAAAFAVLILVAASFAYALSNVVPASVGPQPGPTMPENVPWTVLGEEKLVDPYYWPVDPADGELLDRTPQLSPDGSKLAYLPTVDGKASDLDRIVVRDLASGTERDLTPEEGYSYSIVRWSPDGGSLAFVKSRSNQTAGATSELWRVDADGSNLRLLYRPLPPASAARGPSFTIARWSSDGRTIELAPTIWNAGPEGVPIRHINAQGGGEETTLIPTVGWFGVPQDALVGATVFSPAGDFALQVVKTAPLAERPVGADPDGYSLVLYDVKEQKARVLASFPGQVRLSPADIAPDGQWISIRATSQAPGAPEAAIDLWVVRRDGSGLRQVVDLPTDRQWGGFVWANGGRAFLNMTPQLWVSRADGQLWEVNAASGTARLVAPETWPASVVSASRDGSRLLVGRRVGEHGSLHLLRLGPLPVNPAPVTSPSPTKAPPTQEQGTSPLAVGAAAELKMTSERAGWIWDEATVLRTQDGGVTWTDVTPQGQGSPASLSGRRGYFASAFFLDANTGWVWATIEGANLGVLFRTTDGGLSWDGSTVAVPAGQLTFVDPLHGWTMYSGGAAAGSSPVTIFETLDGGTRWEVVSETVVGQTNLPGTIPPGGTKSGIRFLNEKTGWVVGTVPVDGKPYIFVTHDGGRTWSEQALAIPSEFGKEAFVTAELPVFFSATEGLLPLRVDAKSGSWILFYSSKDGGITWDRGGTAQVPADGTAVSAFADLQHGWLAVSGPNGLMVLLRTADGGSNWEQSTKPDLSTVHGLQFLTAEVGYAFGMGEQGPGLRKTVDGGHTWTAVGIRASGRQTPPAARQPQPKVVHVYAPGRVENVYPDSDVFQPLVQIVELVLQRMDPEVVAAVANPADLVEQNKAQGIGIELVYAEPKSVPQKPGPYTMFYIPLVGEPASEDGVIFLGHAGYSRMVPAGAAGEMDVLRTKFLGTSGGEPATDPNRQSGSGSAPAKPVKPSSAVVRPSETTPSPLAPACDPATLSASAMWQGATGAMAGWVTITNTGSAACSVQGRPFVDLTDASGATLAVKSAPTFDKPDPPGGMVTLQPGQRAGVMFVWHNWCGGKPNLPVTVRLDGKLSAPALDASGAPIAVFPRCDLPEAQSTLSSGPFEAVD